MDHSFDYSHEYDDSYAIVSTSNLAGASGSGGQSSDPEACNQSIIVDNVRNTFDSLFCYVTFAYVLYVT